MARADTILHEVALKILAHNASLDGRHVVFFVNPFNLVASAHIDGNNHAGLLGRKHKGLGHVGAATIRHEHDVVFVGQGNKLLAIFRVSGVQDHVSKSLEAGVSQFPHFLQAGSVRVHDALRLHERTAREVLSAKLCKEIMVNDRGRDILHLFLGIEFMIQVGIEMISDIAREIREVLSSKHVP